MHLLRKLNKEGVIVSLTWLKADLHFTNKMIRLKKHFILDNNQKLEKNEKGIYHQIKEENSIKTVLTYAPDSLSFFFFKKKSRRQR